MPPEQFQSLSANGQGFLRRLVGRVFHAVCLMSTFAGLVSLVVLLAAVGGKSRGWLNWRFLSSFDSYIAEDSGILAGIWGSLWLLALTTIIAVPIGVGAAVYLEEYSKGTRLTRLIQLNLANLAGVPSIVYGILGLTVFVRMFGWYIKHQPGEPDRVTPGLHRFEQVLAEILMRICHAFGLSVPLGTTVIAAAFTLSLLVLPVVIISTQEALRAVPASLRHASYALGATKWQTIRHQVLPASISGILTGVILALSRAVGETAPLIMLGIPVFLTLTPGDITNVQDIVKHPSSIADVPMSRFTALPMTILAWVEHQDPRRQDMAAAAIVVLLVLLLFMNGAAIFIRQHFQKKIRW